MGVSALSGGQASGWSEFGELYRADAPRLAVFAMALGAARDRAAALAHESLAMLWRPLGGSARCAPDLRTPACRPGRPAVAGGHRCTGSAAPARADAARGRPDRPRAAARPAGSRPGGDPRRSASRRDRAGPADRGRRRADGGGRGCAGAARSPRRPRGPGGVRRPGGRHRGRDGRRRRAGARRGRRLHAPHRRCRPRRPRRRTAGRPCRCRTSWSCRRWRATATRSRGCSR